MNLNDDNLPDITDIEAYRNEFVAKLRMRKSQDEFQSKAKQFEYVTKKSSTQQSGLIKIDNGVIKKRKILIVEDHRRSALAWENHRTHLTDGKLTVRNPFKVDEALINYNLDSEDEWAEENGEDLEGEIKGSEDEEEDSDDEDQTGFIVDDGYLSLNEMVDSDIE